MTEKHYVPLDNTPDLTDIAAALPRQYPFLLESAAPGPLGQFSLLLRASGETLCLHQDGTLTGPGGGEGFLGRLNDWFLAEKDNSPSSPCELPFTGGWFIYLGYELAGEIEPVLELPVSMNGLPTALAARCDGAVIVQHTQTPSTFLVAETTGLLDTMEEELKNLEIGEDAAVSPVNHLSADPPAEFEAAVSRIHEYLLDGDVFQVNLSRGWRGRFARVVDPISVYRRLRKANPAPFAGMMRWDEHVLMSSSPERLVEVRGGEVQTRPIAGTHPRDRNPEMDAELSRQMLAHPKERAEHIMLIDLERNDLGRVCETGTVEVSELMVLESYAHVHHIVSNVRGRLRENVTPVDVIRAVFPGGTITGCPKVRCMEIIAELEGQGRGFYTGSMGYISRHGRMDLNILIRSMLVGGSHITFRTGAGIVADSVPSCEVSETEAKARGLLLALEANNAG